MKVVVIGAGVAGLGSGWRLAQAGAEVLILERAQPAHAATWAAGGMIGVTSELGEAQNSEIQFSRYSNSLWPGFAKEIEAESGQSIGYRQDGALMVAASGEELSGFAARAAADPGLRILSAAETRALSPMLTGEYAGALWAEKEAHVDSRALGEALTLAFLRAGGRLETNQAVVRIEIESANNAGGRPYAGAKDRVGVAATLPARQQKAVAAHAAYGLFPADAFVIAAGAWSGELAAPRVEPVKGEMILLAPPPGAALPAQVVWGNGIYLVPRGGHLLVGATVERIGFDTALTDKAADYLFTHAVGLMPGLAKWRLVDHWAGLRPRSADGLPLLGPTATPNVYLASGQYRNGILFAPAIAELICAMVLDQADPIPAFDPRREGA